MTTKNDEKVVELCQRGMQAEEGGNSAKAENLYKRAWSESKTSYQSCIAAHYVARRQDSPEALKWNLESLRQASLASYEDVQAFYPSLYLCIALSYEHLRDFENARKYIQLAKDCESMLLNDDYGRNIREWIEDVRVRLEEKTAQNNP